MEREEIISAIKKNVARCDGVCFTEDLWINSGEDFLGEDLKVDYVEADRIILGDDCYTFYYTFDDLSDEELERVLNAVLPK